MKLKAAGYRPFNLSTEFWLPPDGSARPLSLAEALERLAEEQEQAA